MKDRDWYGIVALAIAIGVTMVGGLAFGLQGRPSSPTPARSSADAGVYLYLTISFNPATGNDQYFPANFSVPSRTLVTVTIMNYDNGTNPISPALADVTGTIGGTESIRTPGQSADRTVSSLPVGGVAHTFTVASVGLNVPVPSAGSPASPATISFEVVFDQTGRLTWNCMAPCDMSSMMTLGFMTGTITVV